MGVDQRVVQWLQGRGHDARHLREEGLHRLPNGEIFAKAIAEDRVILTFDLDFGEIVALSGGKKASVILIRLRNTRTPHVIDRLAAALADSTGPLGRGAVVVIEETRHRVRDLPIAEPGAKP
jgi:predicted nuclease of predicted toxin-antitoxin system